ncbi:hypothetical protein [Streptomyces sp. NRRL S-350]|uniref:hypothetical protein n=1 Tax=Streptomyces sp. NRRL S-350 TaxID=1463902 RepID=UPI00056AA573|nr:hypothetical protein [Streptomyces sp. NRRL S-350]
MTGLDGEHLLAIYLNDHLAGSYAGAALARRIAREHRAGSDAPDLRRLAREIAEDRDELVALMRELGVRPRWHRMLLGAAAEKAGRLKLNGRLVRRSPLSDLLEVEAMRAGVQGKLALWRALRAAAGDGPLGPRLRALQARAEQQADLLDTRQAEAAQVLESALARDRSRDSAATHA